MNSLFQQSLSALSTIVSAIAAYLFAPWLHGLTVGWIVSLSVGLYGHSEWNAALPWVWWAVVALFLFSAVRIVIVTVLSLLGFALTSRVR